MKSNKLLENVGEEVRLEHPVFVVLYLEPGNQNRYKWWVYNSQYEWLKVVESDTVTVEL